ncbi:MAG: hypothetical protein LKH33_01545 [Acetobacter sp.]|jgi:hypothetical protein|nr:hypothetical protein [Acetobacter sp.]MCI1586325.1 hypothetical protein [Acetobacter sp.]MCI1599996.1 hypothetical protein [Acetobacter sp.]
MSAENMRSANLFFSGKPARCRHAPRKRPNATISGHNHRADKTLPCTYDPQWMPDDELYAPESSIDAGTMANKGWNEFFR